MKLLASVAVVISVSITLSGQSRPPLTDADVDELVVLGRANKLNGLIGRCTAVRVSGLAGPLSIAGVVVGAAGAVVQAALNGGTDKYVVNAMGPRGWVARGVWDASSTGRTVTRADIPLSWREQALYVVVVPVFPKPDSNDEPAIPSPIRTVTLKSVPVSQSQPIIQLQPVGELTFVDRTWKNARGTTVDYRETTARFDPATAARFEGESVDVTVVTEGGSRSCELLARNLSKFAKEGGKK